MIEYLIHLATVAALALGVIPLGVLIFLGGVHDLRHTSTVRGVLGALAMTLSGVVLVVLSLMVFVDGVVK